MGTPFLTAILAMLSIALIFWGFHRSIGSSIDIAARLGTSNKRKHSQSSEQATSGPIAAKMDKAIAGSNFASHIQRELARANLKLTVAEYLMMSATSILSFIAIAFLISQNPVVALVGGVFGFYLPRLYVRQRQVARQKAFNNQLADTIVLIANSLRSGYSLLQSLDLVSREAPEPTSEEFSRVVKEVNLGLSPEEALAHLVNRIESDDLDLMVSAINVQHEVGGNLAQILDTIASTIRERVRVKGEIKSLTSQQTLSGYVISLLPVGLGFILFLLNSKYMMQLFSTETVICMPVLVLPICSGVLIFIGFMVMRRITDIEV
ncbi:MAG: type II secretion system F family protein [Chloroflexi bacterium]|nr:type II secretion system F family protein [Chloroflexota bacterium]